MSMHNPKVDLPDLDRDDLEYLLDGLMNLKEVVNYGDWYNCTDTRPGLEENFDEKIKVLEGKIRKAGEEVEV